MDEAAKQRRRQERIRQQKQKRMVTIVIIALIVILLIVFAVVTLTKKPSDDSAQGVITVTPAEDEDGQTEEDESAADTLTLTEEQKYTGDLILVNANYPYHFEENQPAIHLTQISTFGNGIRTAREDLELANRILDPLSQMIAACNQALGVEDTGVTSAYRSEAYQQQTFDEYVQDYGQEYAESYVAEPGYSEHHTGLSLDMGIYYDDGSPGQFSGSGNAQWMDENCQEYGFVRRFKEDKVNVTGISNESWHFRYVGIPHATYMNSQNLCLEEYIQYLRDNTTKDAPLTVTCGDKGYEIYSVKESTTEAPKGEYTVSGDNIDGYIVTVVKE